MFSEEVARLKELSVTVSTIASVADAAKAYSEFRFLNQSPPIIIGGEDSQYSDNVAAVKAELMTLPVGKNNSLTSVLRDVTNQIQETVDLLIITDKVGLILILSDGGSIDHGIVNSLRDLERTPTRVVVILFSIDKKVMDFWQSINAELDIDMIIIGDIETECACVAEYNNWLTYGDPLHRAREFGIMIPAIDALSDRQLTKLEIKTVAEILLTMSYDEPISLPDPMEDWGGFIDALALIMNNSDSNNLPTLTTAGSGSGLGGMKSSKNNEHDEEYFNNSRVYCPIRRKLLPWIDVEELRKYSPDPIQVFMYLYVCMLGC